MTQNIRQIQRRMGEHFAFADAAPIKVEKLKTPAGYERTAHGTLVKKGPKIVEQTSDRTAHGRKLTKSDSDTGPFKKGQFVKHKNTGSVGEVVESNEDMTTVRWNAGPRKGQSSDVANKILQKMSYDDAKAGRADSNLSSMSLEELKEELDGEMQSVRSAMRDNDNKTIIRCKKYIRELQEEIAKRSSRKADSSDPFSKGDRVKINAPGLPGHGKSGKILGKSNDHYQIQSGPDDHKNWMHPASRLTKV